MYQIDTPRCLALRFIGCRDRRRQNRPRPSWVWGIEPWHRIVLAASCTESLLVEVEVRRGDPTFCDLPSRGEGPAAMCDRNRRAQPLCASPKPARRAVHISTVVVHLAVSCPQRALQSGHLRSTADVTSRGSFTAGDQAATRARTRPRGVSMECPASRGKFTPVS